MTVGRVAPLARHHLFAHGFRVSVGVVPAALARPPHPFLGQPVLEPPASQAFPLLAPPRLSLAVAALPAFHHQLGELPVHFRDSSIPPAPGRSGGGLR